MTRSLWVMFVAACSGSSGKTPPADAAVGFAAQPAPGRYTIVTPGAGSAADAIAVAQQDGNANLAIAGGGMLTLESGGAGCLAGHFTATFGSDTVTGMFGANTCN